MQLAKLMTKDDGLCLSEKKTCQSERKHTSCITGVPVQKKLWQELPEGDGLPLLWWGPCKQTKIPCNNLNLKSDNFSYVRRNVDENQD